MLIEELFDNLNVTVEPFAVCVVADGWRMDLPDPPGAIVHFVLDGVGELELGRGNRAAMRPGTFVLVPAGRHSIANGERPAQAQTVHVEGRRRGGPLADVVVGIEAPGALHFACGHVMADYAGGLDLFALLDRPIVLDRSGDRRIATTIQGMLEESAHAAPGQSTMLGALMRQCLVLMLRELCEGPDCRLPWLTALESPRLSPVLRHVLRHPAAPHTVESLAATAGLSRSAFADAFSDAFDQTPMSFVREVRLQRAAELLRTSSMPVASVARRSGIASRSHFSRLFTARFGRTPGEYRRGAVEETSSAGP